MTASDSSVKRDADSSRTRDRNLDLEVPSGSTEVRLAGSAGAFRRLASLIEEVARGAGTRRFPGTWQETGNVRAPRGETNAATLIVEGGDGPVRVRAEPEKRTVRLVGGKRILYIAAWLKALADRPGRSVRLGWYPGHFYLAERTIPLALRCRGETSGE